MVEKTGENIPGTGPLPKPPGSAVQKQQERIEKISGAALQIGLEEEEWDHETTLFDPKTGTPKWVVDAEALGQKGLTLRMPEDKKASPVTQTAMPINRMAYIFFLYMIKPLTG